jgi:CheY-like chemotaxis protein
MSEGTMAATILVVDDEQDVRTYLRTLFAKAGYTVEMAEDGEAGLTAAKKVRPDLIFLDIMMPKRTGIMLYRRLKKDEELAKTPVVILTGLAQYRSFFAQDFEQVPHPEEFVEKPPKQEKLLELAQKFAPLESDG